MTATCSRRFPNLAPSSAQGMKGADPIAPSLFTCLPSRVCCPYGRK
jgi:hypothetical protein